MKKLFVLATLLILCVQSICGQEMKIDTVYFSGEKGVPNASLAKEYYVIYTPLDARYQTTFRKYSIDNVLVADGGLFSFDAFDKKKIMWDGTCTSYYPSGKVKIIAEYRNGASNGSYNEFYENGQVKTSTTALDGHFDGKVTKYYESGKLHKIYTCKRHLLNGSYKEYQENGTLIRNQTYIDGVLTGASFYNNKREMFKQLDLTDDLVATVGVTLENMTFYNLYVSGTTNGGAKLYCEKDGINGRAHLLKFELYFRNNSNEERDCHIENIHVFFLNKGKPSKDMWIGRDTYLSVCKYALDTYTTARFNEAEYNAHNAATTTSTNNQKGYASSYSNASYYGNNQYNANAKTSYNGSTGVTTSSHTTQTDGNLEYQIYQQEKEKAAQDVESWKMWYANCEEFSKYDNLSISANKQCNVWIASSAYPQKYDTIRITFTVNGKQQVVEWLKSECE